MKISDIDSNLKVETRIQQEHLRFFDATKSPFHIYGVTPGAAENGDWLRLPEEVAKQTSDGVAVLNHMTAGGRIRFKTDSQFVAIRVEWAEYQKMPHMAPTGTSGVALYRTIDGVETFWGTFMPGENWGFEGILHPGAPGMTDFTLYLPLFNSIRAIYIGLHEDCHIEEPTPYAIAKPIVYYGSSITHGGCCCRPGTDYEGFLSRMLGADYVNLGFSGSAKGEQVMAQYIAGLDMSMFVLDYDHNAPSVEHLEKTHEAFYQTIRAAQPDLPILIISKPQKILFQDDRNRLEVIRRTYDRAVAVGDRNVYFIDGSTFHKDLLFNDATVDGVHPTDLGFYLMAQGIYPVMKDALKRSNSAK